ncbi:MAG: hypothetical protein LBD03_00225, partial [Methanobrevibacter sp.]|nr:hypothetical protein [Candidatus Methanovirga procula]
SILKELISIFPMIKVFNLNTWANDKFKKVNDEYYSTSMGLQRFHLQMLHSIALLSLFPQYYS